MIIFDTNVLSELMKPKKSEIVRVLTFDQAAAVAFANIASQRRHNGTPISQADAQIAAICYTHAATIATRNFSDFEGCGISIINPWEVSSR